METFSWAGVEDSSGFSNAPDPDDQSRGSLQSWRGGNLAICGWSTLTHVDSVEGIAVVLD